MIARPTTTQTTQPTPSPAAPCSRVLDSLARHPKNIAQELESGREDDDAWLMVVPHKYAMAVAKERDEALDPHLLNIPKSIENMITPQQRNLRNAIVNHAGDANHDLNHTTAALIRVLGSVIEGIPVEKAMGAPGSWGYGTPIGDALLAMLQAPKPVNA